MLTEADTCRKYVVPKLQGAGWDTEPHSIAEQRFFTDGRIIVRGSRASLRPTDSAAQITLSDLLLPKLLSGDLDAAVAAEILEAHA